MFEYNLMKYCLNTHNNRKVLGLPKKKIANNQGGIITA